MAAMKTNVDAEVLLGHADFLRSLARHLVHDGAEAEDVVQETYSAVLKSPPADAERPLRPWLAQVLRNVVRSAGRSASRRRRREREVGGQVGGRVGGDDVAPATDEVMARMETYRRVVELMTSLDEPYRSTLLLRFYEGREAAEIARAADVPAGTVRWRISEGLKRLRAGLDERHGGRRDSWRAALVPAGSWAAPQARAGMPVAVRAARPGWFAGTMIFGTGAALVVVGALALRSIPPGSPAVSGSDGRARATRGDSAVAPSLARQEQNKPTTEKSTMSRATLKNATILFGVALPALVAGAEKVPEPALNEAAVNGCVELREKVFECDAAFAELFIKNAPAERKNALRGKVLEEIAADGAGPVEPRRKKCADMLSKRPMSASREQLAAFEQGLRACYAKTDCQARASCLWPIMERLNAGRNGGK
jgi:RNA polymerase sigma factor (sigma-70 family)